MIIKSSSKVSGFHASNNHDWFISSLLYNFLKFFKDKKGNQYGLNDILKTSYFGGKGAGSGTKVEDANLSLAGDRLQKAIEENNNKLQYDSFTGTYFLHDEEWEEPMEFTEEELEQEGIYLHG